MRQMLVSANLEGRHIARPVYARSGTVALQAGTRLTEAHVHTLRQQGYHSVYVEDPAVEDVQPTPLVGEPVLLEAARALEHLLGELRASHDPLQGYTALAALQRAGVAMAREVLSSPADAELDTLLFLPALPPEVGHPLRTALLALALGREARLGVDDLQHLAHAALLADVGCALLPTGAAPHPGPLEPPDGHEHPDLSFHVVQRYGHLSARVAAAVAAHHENWDGSGYPGHLRGAAIFPLARVLRISEAFDGALHPPSGQGLPPHQAIEFIMGYAGEWFDPELVQPFARRISIYPKGLTVQLNTGEVAVVTAPNVGHIGRPRVRVVAGPERTRLDCPVDVGQAHHQSRLIAGPTSW